MNKRGLVSESALIKTFELLMVLFIFAVLMFNVRAEVRNRALDQSYETVDLALETTLISSAPGKLEVSYPKAEDFGYSIDEGELLVRYGFADKTYRLLIQKPVELKEIEGNVVIKQYG